MKCLAYLFLILFVATHASVNTNADVSNNVLSNNFMDDWAGTNDNFHGSSILAGVHDKYREQTITLSDHLSPMEIQGVTSTEFNAEVWFWNQYDQSVDLTQEITDSNGLTYSNTITMSGDCNTFNGCGYETSPTNTIIITNPSSDYDITARFDFTIPSHPNYHYAADVKDPSLVVNYNPLSIDLSTTNDLSLWLDDFEESFTQEFTEPDFYIMEDIFEEEELLFNDYFTFEEPGVIFLPQEPTELPDLMFTDEGPIFFSEDEMVIEELISDIETMMPDMSEEMMDELIEEMIEEMPEPEESLEEESIEEEKEEVITEEKEETSLEEKNFLEEEETESQTVTSFVSIKKENDITVPEFSSLDLTISIDQLSFDELVSSQPILTDVPFYEPIILYPNQLSYVDSRDIYSNVVYVANDSLTKHNFDVQENQKQTFKLQYKLRSMTWMD
jgi:hypothetical protein